MHELIFNKIYVTPRLVRAGVFNDHSHRCQMSTSLFRKWKQRVIPISIAHAVEIVFEYKLVFGITSIPLQLVTIFFVKWIERSVKRSLIILYCWSCIYGHIKPGETKKIWDRHNFRNYFASQSVFNNFYSPVSRHSLKWVYHITAWDEIPYNGWFC